MINDTAAHTAEGAWMVPLSDGARITYAEATFEMTPGTTAGQAAIVALWDSSLTSSPAQVWYIENGYYVQVCNTTMGWTTIGSHFYSSPGSGVQSVKVALDVATQTLTVVGADGVEPDGKVALSLGGDERGLYTAKYPPLPITLRRL